MSKVEFPKWLYTERDTELALIASYESGQVRSGINRGSGMVDDTAASLSRAKERLTNVESLILMFEKLARG
jgi:hypothetical protein